MTHYRLYYLNCGSGHIERAEDIDARDDVHAYTIAAELMEPQPMELWCASRKVHRFEATLTARVRELRVAQFARRREA